MFDTNLVVMFCFDVVKRRWRSLDSADMDMSRIEHTLRLLFFWFGCIVVVKVVNCLSYCLGDKESMINFEDLQLCKL